MVFLAAFVPFTVYVTAAGPVLDHVYVRFDSPRSDAPITLRFVVVPAAGLGLALAAVLIVGGASATVTAAVPLTVPSVARTRALPAVVPLE
jgi:hypothetical protein